MTVEPFAFETTYDLRAVQEAQREQVRNVSGRWQDKMLIAGGITGFVLLLSWYTFALGAFILAACTFAFAMENRVRRAPDRLRAMQPSPVTLRVTEAGYSLSTPTSTTTATWENVRGFNEAGGYLALHAWQIGGLFLPVEELRAAGVYDRIKALAESRRAAFAAAMQATT
jgi:hypothetical protein